MRVSTAQVQRQGTEAMLQRFSELAKTQLQLSTGKRINKTSDDPLGATQLLPLKDMISIHEQYSRNSNTARGRLSFEDNTLGQFNAVLVRINELTIQGNNDVLDATSRSAIAEEMRRNLETLVDLANTRDGNGDYLFAGDNVRNPAVVENPPGTFTYAGDSGQRQLQISLDRTVPVGDPGDDVFMNIPFSGGGTQSIFDTVYSVITNLEANQQSPTQLQDLQSAMDNVSATRARVGARLNTLDTQDNVNEDLILRSRQTISDLEDLDVAEAVSRLNIQLLGLQASQQAFSKIQNLSLFNHI